MTITINIKPSLEEKLKELSSKQGTDISLFINDLLQKQLQIQPSKEDELLEKINLGISERKWSIYYQLIEKRKAEILTKKEHRELISITNEIEEANAERMKYLVQLSQLRKVSLQTVMLQLGIQPRKNV